MLQLDGSQWGSDILCCTALLCDAASESKARYGNAQGAVQPGQLQQQWGNAQGEARAGLTAVRQECCSLCRCDRCKHCLGRSAAGRGALLGLVPQHCCEATWMQAQPLMRGELLGSTTECQETIWLLRGQRHQLSSSFAPDTSTNVLLSQRTQAVGLDGCFWLASPRWPLRAVQVLEVLGQCSHAIICQLALSPPCRQLLHLQRKPAC